MQRRSTQRQSGEGKVFIHVTPSKNDSKWHVKEIGSKDEPRVYDTKEQAVKEAERDAREKSAREDVKSHVVIHDEHGKFEVVENFESH
ncbi:DUF2188 domain-containing protein [Wolbachia pipientis]|nr:DUF2188 domain-containing protein [Wolbachia pipientis]